VGRVRAQIKERLDEAAETLRRTGPAIGASLHALVEPGDITLGSTEFASILHAVESFDSGAAQSSSDLRQRFDTMASTTDVQMASWRTKEAEVLQQIETKRKELEAQGLRLDMAHIQKLTRDEATHHTNVVNLNTWKPHLTQLRKDRADVLKRGWSARDNVATLRNAYAHQASEVLDRELTNPKVSLKFVRDGYSPAAAELISTTMAWRTIQVPRATLLVEQLTVPALLRAIDKNDKRVITELKTADGVRLFDNSDASQLLERLGQKHVRFALERCEVHDLPKLIVTKKIDEGGKPRYVRRGFGRLSLGQQQSVLLALVLCSSGNHPLIVDQPEDNLDGEFIYHTLVPVLRRAKERRQIIVVTHNANIAVLGDAELIVALKGGAEKGLIICRGSIDHELTREEACKVLEGAKEAFQRRARTYGFRVLLP
jgi:energy-coupling factor transporter ATP-binding protein EcfA2